jgi:SAM-dependent methyltransferase
MIEDTARCPVCGATTLTKTAHRQRLPAMQNRLYRLRELAIAATAGRFSLAICAGCGFGFNAAFDPALVQYDQDYDNSVPSAAFDRYYDEIARYLKAKYLGENGLVVDIGCGKGRFLHALCRLFPGMRGLGVDPSYEGPENDLGGRLRFLPHRFTQQVLKEKPDLVVCRHVLEHIESPMRFVEEIGAGLTGFAEVPIFWEVPDLRWIIASGAFWDFCYEHCNYFTSDSLAFALRRAGFTPTAARASFGGQYLWVDSIWCGRPEASRAPEAPELVRLVQDYVIGEHALIERAGTLLEARKREGWNLAIWGLATKGVLYCCLLDPDATRFDACIDVNANKQGAYVPVSGHRISAPSILSQFAGPWVIVVMNPNYLEEIRATVAEAGVQARFMAAGGDFLDTP